MPTVFIHSHAELIELSRACRAYADKLREYAAATSSITAKHILLNAASVSEGRAARFAAAAENQLVMWKIHRKQ